MSFTTKVALFEPPLKLILTRALSLTKRSSRLKPPVRFVSERLIKIEVKFVDRYVPDELLLFYMNLLDKHVPPKAIDFVIEELDKRVPPKVRSSVIAAADGYVPDSVASSRKLSAVIAGFGKYIPDRLIPADSASNWSNLKMKFHIPTLLSRGQSDSGKE